MVVKNTVLDLQIVYLWFSFPVTASMCAGSRLLLETSALPSTYP